MVRLYGSYNGRYFIAQFPGEVRIHRGSAFQWTRPVSNVRETLAVGNNGEVFFRTESGVFVRLPYDRNAQLTKVELFRARPEENVRLGKLRINADGREFCYEKIQPEKRLSEKIFRLLGKKDGDGGGASSHSLNLLNPRSSEALSFFSATLTPGKDDRFLWEVSPYFIYLVVAQTEKKGLVFQVINIPDKAVTAEFEMGVQNVTRIFVNDQGTVMLEVKQENAVTLVIVSANGKFLLEPPPNYRVLHLGADWVAFQTMVDPHIIVRRFDKSLVVTADLRPLAKLGVEYRFLVNDRGDLDLVTFAEDVVTVHNTDFRNLETDAKRWELLARQAAAQEEGKVARQAIEEHQERVERMAREEKQREMMTDIRASAPVTSLPLELEPSSEWPPRLELGLELEEPAPRTSARGSEPASIPLPLELPEETPGPLKLQPRSLPAPPAPAMSSDDIARQLEKLQMQYIAGEVGREEYYRRKNELESARKNATARPAAAPKMLEIEPVSKLDVPRSEPPAAPPTLGKSPRLELGRSLRPPPGEDSR
ncbi:hypothetical protein DYH09_14015 [bacterium CPR1]|nr:hypothetical protein [bacterium CPR1]